MWAPHPMMLQGVECVRVQTILDAAENNGIVSSSLDVHLLESGALQRLCQIGARVLGEAVALQLQRQTAVLGVQDAWLATRNEPLGRLFDLLGLDGRLRKHRVPLDARGKAEIVRAVVGEAYRSRPSALGRTIPSRASLEASCKGFLEQELTGELAAVLAQLHLDNRPAPVRGSSLDVDRALVSLLGAGSCRGILVRLRELHHARERRKREQAQCSLVSQLPGLNLMRLSVFVKALHALCTGKEAPRSENPVDHQALVALVVDAVLAAGLDYLPCESSEQLDGFVNSRFLNEAERGELLKLLVPADARPASPPRSSSPASGGWGGRPASPPRSPRPMSRGRRGRPTASPPRSPRPISRGWAVRPASPPRSPSPASPPRSSSPMSRGYVGPESSVESIGGWAGFLDQPQLPPAAAPGGPQPYPEQLFRSASMPLHAAGTGRRSAGVAPAPAKVAGDWPVKAASAGGPVPKHLGAAAGPAGGWRRPPISAGPPQPVGSAGTDGYGDRLAQAVLRFNSMVAATEGAGGCDHPRAPAPCHHWR